MLCRNKLQTGHLYSVFKEHLTEASYLFEIVHTMTPEDISNDIRKDMNGKAFRVLFATNSAGMGVNIYDVYNVIYFGVPMSMDLMVQQFGRAGRVGTQSRDSQTSHVSFKKCKYSA